MSYPIESTSPVNKMIGFEIKGNVIPQAWFQTIKMPSGKPDTIAIMLLADVVYWYRPVEMRDEKTGAFVGYRKKFKADRLQRDYSTFVNLYGFTKNQIRDAFNRLEAAGILKITHETVTLPDRILGNVMFIELIFSGLENCTYPTLPDSIRYPIRKESNTLLDLNPIGVRIESNTYTESTQIITTDNSQKTKPQETGGEYFEIYESNIGSLTPIVAEQLQEIKATYPPGWFEEAVKIAINQNVRRLSYIQGILNRWAVDGFKTDAKSPAGKPKNLEIFIGSRYEEN